MLPRNQTMPEWRHPFPTGNHISGATYALVQDFFECEYRGEIDAKGKGAVPMFFLLSIRPELSADAEGLLPFVAFQEKRQQLLSTLLW